jgi:hypothetical protein
MLQENSIKNSSIGRNSPAIVSALGKGQECDQIKVNDVQSDEITNDNMFLIADV